MPDASPRRALITGVTGQDGLYLSERLLAEGYRVFGLVRSENTAAHAQLTAAVPEVTPLVGDITDFDSVAHAIAVAEPDEVYNLAGITSVAMSWQNPRLAADVTAKGALNVLEATRLHCGDDPGRVRFFQASSSEMFGNSDESPQRETTALRPRSPYAVSKVFAHQLTANYREAHGMHASSGILFNHESPRRPLTFVFRKISHGVARIALGLQPELTLGNIDIRRDWGYAGDYVAAMHAMLRAPEPDDYVIATGESHTIRDLLDAAFAFVGIDDWEPYVRRDESLIRPAEMQVAIGDISKAESQLGWRPQVDFTALVRLMVEHDLEGARSSSPQPSS